MSTITVSESGGSVSVTGGTPSTTITAEDSGTATLDSTDNTPVTFSTARDNANYTVQYELQSLSNKAKFEARSMGEIATTSKTASGFTIECGDNLDGVVVRWSIYGY